MSTVFNAILWVDNTLNPDIINNINYEKKGV